MIEDEGHRTVYAECLNFIVNCEEEQVTMSHPREFLNIMFKFIEFRLFACCILLGTYTASQIGNDSLLPWSLSTGLLAEQLGMHI